MESAKKRPTEKTSISKLRVFIVDDHAVVRHGFTQRINIEDDMQVCGTADSVQAALDQIDRLQPDVALVDISLGKRDGLELIKDLKSRGDQAHIVVVSGHDESVYAERCLRAGAQGYLHKAEAIDKVVDAIRTAAAGDYYLSDAATKKALQRAAKGDAALAGSPIDSFSDRELQVYELLGQGLTVREIGEKLFLSPKTIETYRGHLKRKLSIETSSELTRHAMRWATENAS